MKVVRRALKAVYDFFAGDAILLVGALVAFAAAFLLSRVAANLLAAIVFIVAIVASLSLTLLREKGGRVK